MGRERIKKGPDVSGPKFAVRGRENYAALAARTICISAQVDR